MSEAPDQDKPRTWKYTGLTWNEGDVKLAVITVGGTLLGGLLLALMLGLALIVAHWLEPRHPSVIGVTLTAVGVVALFWYAVSPPKPPVKPSARWAMVFLCLRFMAAQVVILSLLALIGLAAGIK